MPPTPDAAPFTDIGNDELAQLLAQGVAVVDVRTPPEWTETGVVPGSHRLTFFDARGRHDAAGWLEAMRAISPPEAPVILICRSGARTVPVSQFLAQVGAYKTVYNVQAGILDWIREGRPVDRV